MFAVLYYKIEIKAVNISLQERIFANLFISKGQFFFKKLNTFDDVEIQFLIN